MHVENHTADQINNAFSVKRAFFDNGNTRDYQFRLQSLKKLRNNIHELQDELTKAMAQDFGKPSYDVFIGEIGVALSEVTYAINNLDRWMAPVSVNTPITIMPASSRIYSDPKGVVAIFSPWNYPFNLSVIPLVGAIAAGNCVLLKVASETPYTSLVTEKLIRLTFDPEHVSVVMGEGSAIGKLMFDNCIFNHVFFTGSPTVGKWIMAQAAATLTPVTLELGGKSPTIVDKTANLPVAINRILWAKYSNAGQTCLAPDYLLLHEDIKDTFIAKFKAQIEKLYGTDPSKSASFARIVNTKRFDRLIELLGDGNIIHGGNSIASERYIEPTVMLVDDLNQQIMGEEIFGPILPIIIWKNREELLPIIRRNRYPLTCYVYTSDTTLEKFIIENVEFGSGAINDSMAQFANHNMPFGGVQTSGIGKYHGKYSFDTFSNQKPVLKTWTWIDLPLRYIPYTKWKWSLARLFMR